MTSDLIAVMQHDLSNTEFFDSISIWIPAGVEAIAMHVYCNGLALTLDKQKLSARDTS